MELSRSEIENLIDQYVLHERNRNILKDRLLDGMIYERLAEKYDLTVRQIQNIVYKETERIYRHFP